LVGVLGAFKKRGYRSEYPQRAWRIPENHFPTLGVHNEKNEQAGNAKELPLRFSYCCDSYTMMSPAWGHRINCIAYFWALGQRNAIPIVAASVCVCAF